MYDKYVRPVVHGVYHAARGIKSGNRAEWDRAKDQFSKVGMNIFTVVEVFLIYKFS